MLSKYQLISADFYNIFIGDVKRLVLNFFDKEKHVLHYEKLQFYWRIGLKLEKIHLALDFNQIQWLKPYVELNTQRIIEPEKNDNKDGKAFYKFE